MLAAAVALVFAGSLMSYGYLTRPQIFTYLFLAIFWAAIDRFAADRRSWVLWWLPPLAAFWVNSHGGVLAGVGVFGIAATILAIRPEGRTTLIATAALSAGSIGGNPRCALAPSASGMFGRSMKP